MSHGFCGVVDEVGRLLNLFLNLSKAVSSFCPNLSHHFLLEFSLLAFADPPPTCPPSSLLRFLQNLPFCVLYGCVHSDDSFYCMNLTSLCFHEVPMHVLGPNMESNFDNLQFLPQHLCMKAFHFRPSQLDQVERALQSNSLMTSRHIVCLSPPGSWSIPHQHCGPHFINTNIYIYICHSSPCPRPCFRILFRFSGHPQ